MIPDQVQTSPYLTFVRPHEPAPVIYVSDTRGPEYPDATEPGDARFGVIGLDRQVIWRSDPAALSALDAAAKKPIETGALIDRYGRDVVTELVKLGWLQTPSDLCREYWVRTGQIEITAHCNWGCAFCPVSQDPKPRETMPVPLFTEIVEKLSVYETMRYVTFHFFNEPTLDRYFADRIRILERYGVKLELSTNASALTADKIELLADSGVMHHLVVNVPSLDKEEFHRLSRAHTFAQSQRNLDQAIRAQAFPIELAVNGLGKDVADNVATLREHYGPLGVTVNPTQTCDRAGTVEGEYFQDVHVRGRLRGCSWPVNHPYFSVCGDMFICCNDYYQREIFGNIRDGSVDDIMTSPAAVTLRRRVFGVEKAPDDYICRTCHDQKLDFVHRQFRPLATFPLELSDSRGCPKFPGAKDE